MTPLDLQHSYGSPARPELKGMPVAQCWASLTGRPSGDRPTAESEAAQVLPGQDGTDYMRDDVPV